MLAARRRASRDSGQLADTLIRPELNRHVPRQAKCMLLAKLIELTGLDWLAGLDGRAGWDGWLAGLAGRLQEGIRGKL